VAAYRDALRMLLRFAARRIGTAPARLQIEDVDAPLIGAFLDHLEHERDNSARSRNTRLAAIHSLFRFAALRHPEHAALIARVLAIPPKGIVRLVISAAEVDDLGVDTPEGDQCGRGVVQGPPGSGGDHRALRMAVSPLPAELP
jgi:integrase/recombinase XerD